MKFPRHKVLVIFFIILALASCNNKKQSIDNKIVTSFDGGQITMEQLDQTVQDQIFEQLFGIYYVRRLALDELLGETLIEAEANKRGFTTEHLLRLEVYDKLSESGLEKFKIQQGITSEVRDPNNPFTGIKLASATGKTELWNQYKKKSLQEYVESLTVKYNVTKKLVPPMGPLVKLDSIPFNSAGAEKSPNNVWIVSDFHCSSCQAAHPSLNVIYEKYKDKFQFRFTNLSNSIDIQSVACECAAKQGEFKYFYDYIYERNGADSLELVAEVQRRGKLNSNFVNCLKDQSVRQHLALGMNILKQKKILNTPSIFVNNRLYHGQISVDMLSAYLDDVLSKEMH